jgi:hypothetical protein
MWTIPLTACTKEMSNEFIGLQRGFSLDLLVSDLYQTKCIYRGGLIQKLTFDALGRTSSSGRQFQSVTDLNNNVSQLFQVCWSGSF